MRMFLVAVLVVSFSAVSAVGSSEGELIARTIQTYEQIESIRSQMRDAVGDLAAEKRSYELAMYELKGDPMTAEQLAKLATDIKQQVQILHRYKTQGASEDSIAYAKKRIRDLSLMHRAGKLTTTEQREAFRAKVQPKIDGLAGKIQVIEAPFQAKIQELQSSADVDNDALNKLIRPHFNAPKSAYPSSKVQHLNATVHMAFASANWNNSENTQIAWAHVRIRSLDEIEDYHREQLLDGKYPIQSLSDGSIWVWAGHFLITFVADDEAITGEENIQKAIHQFIDLESLAAISGETEQVATGKIDE